MIGILKMKPAQLSILSLLKIKTKTLVTGRVYMGGGSGLQGAVLLSPARIRREDS